VVTGGAVQGALCRGETWSLGGPCKPALCREGTWSREAQCKAGCAGGKRGRWRAVLAGASAAGGRQGRELGTGGHVANQRCRESAEWTLTLR